MKNLRSILPLLCASLLLASSCKKNDDPIPGDLRSELEGSYEFTCEGTRLKADGSIFDTWQAKFYYYVIKSDQAGSILFKSTASAKEYYFRADNLRKIGNELVFDIPEQYYHGGIIMPVHGNPYFKAGNHKYHGTYNLKTDEMKFSYTMDLEVPAFSNGVAHLLAVVEGGRR